MTWRTLSATLIVSASVSFGTARAQQLEPAAAPPPTRADAEKAEQAKRAELEKAQVELQLRQERLAADAARAAEVNRRTTIEIESKIAEAERAALRQRLLAEQKVIGARKYREAVAKQFRRENVAYCGVSISEAPPVVASQLKLAPGTGVVVDLVIEKSPAEAAGIKQHDVITKLDDQVLANAEQFRALVRMKKPSDGVKLSVIRGGEPVSVNIQLGQQEVEEAVGQGDIIDPNLNRFERALVLDAGGQLNVAPQVVDIFTAGGGGGGMAVTNFNGKNQAVWSDEKHVLTMEMKDGKAVKLTAKDPAGKQLFDGPVETEDQRKALPAEIGETLKKAEAGGRFQFKINAPGGIAAAAPGGNRPRVVTSNDKDTLLLARVEGGRTTYAFAFSEADGKTLFDGPVATDEQRKGLPEAVAKQIDTLEKNLGAATEFGVVGRN